MARSRYAIWQTGHALLLLLCSQLALAAEAPAPSEAVSTVNPEQYWQSQDWQQSGEAKQIGEQWTLFHKSNQGYRLGLALLLPDWQQVADLLPLSRHLNEQGFDTLFLLPDPRQLELDPYDEKDQIRIEAFRELWLRQLANLQTNSGEPSGYQLLIAAGSSAAWLAGELKQDGVTPPDGLILIDAFYPAAESNAVLAEEIAKATMPVLDLYQQGKSGWLDQAARERALATRRENKLDWRQIPLQSQAQRLDLVVGWLRFQGIK